MEAIKEFLKKSIDCSSGYGDGMGCGNGSGSNDGFGYGYGSGSDSICGVGDGDGCGDGSGYGFGDGVGYGDGSGFGDGIGIGIKSINGYEVHFIDKIKTIIKSVRNNVAKGFILNGDLSFTPCFIVKENNVFSHGDTLEKAVRSLQYKLFESYTIEERIAKFKETFADYNKKYSAQLLFEWHHNLTLSCWFGRQQWVKDKGIDLNTDTFTIHEFIKLTKNSYGSKIIELL